MKINLSTVPDERFSPLIKAIMECPETAEELALKVKKELAGKETRSLVEIVSTAVEKK